MKNSSNLSKYYSPLIGAALAAASLFHFSLPAFAAGTPAGDILRNRATGTYDDGTTTYEVISNEVTVTVGKVAGITNVPDGFVDSTADTPVLPGDTVGFDFKVTNTGNDASRIFIPSASTINDNAVNVTIPTAADSVQYRLETDPDVPGSYQNVPPSGIIPDIAADVSIIVRVTGTVDAGANINDTVSVRLGDTGPNNNDTDTTQNQLDVDPGRTEDDPQTGDVRTLTGTAPTVPGDPVNRQREASALNALTVGSNPLALTKISKTARSPVNNGGTPNILTDDVITYDLSLDVLAQKLNRYNNFSFNPAALEGRDYRTATTGSFSTAGTAFAAIEQSNLILISDAVPEGAAINKATVGTTVTAPNANWTPVYTGSALTVSPDEADWDTDATQITGAITRIGWIYDARATGGDGAIASSAVSTTGFSFQVITNGVTNTATSIYNIAQVFGSTDDGDDAATGGVITFDESGDENPNNLNDDGTAGPGNVAVGGEFGVADPDVNDDGTEDNVDIDGDNTATGSVGGEVNKVTLSPAPVAPDLLNGPINLPQAIGEVFGQAPDNNHDFQNAGGEVPAATDQTIDANGNPNTVATAPTVINFTNTVQNTESGAITDVVLQPVAPNALGLGGTNADLPNGTTVTLTYLAQTATYTYTAANGFTTAGTPVIIPAIQGTSAGAGNNNVNYEVQVTLPTDTPLSTNDGAGAYPVPVAAYKDTDNTGANPLVPTTGTYAGNGLTTDDTYNVTVNQAYLGYLKLVKKARILRDANAQGVYDDIFTPVTGMGFDDPDGGKTPAPGDIIEYQIEYSNISEPQGNGSNNVILNAENVQINENGTAGTNNWGLDSDDVDTIIDTLHVPGFISTVGTNTGTTTYFDGVTGSGSSDDADREVTRYLYNAGNVAPTAPGGTPRTFTFQRKVTDESDIEDLSTP